MSDEDLESSPLEGIAIVGMTGRFPGADDLAELWRNLCGGVEGITFYSREKLEAAGVETALLDDPRYVRAGAALRDVQGFDAGFFGFSPREAELMDPQQRIFLECCWEALESAGYDTETYAGSIGVFAGMGMGGYLIHNLLSHRDLIRNTGALQVRILNDNNYLTAMAAFKLDLRGPSVTVQSACSTSLVAVCMASQSLLQFQCDMVLAGGVTVVVPHALGYLAQESVMSPDGHCRAFDAGARGTVEGSGAGVVVLKRLSDAVAEGDTIHAVIRGFATNNDGGFKLSFTAPSQDGQLEVVAMAQAMAGVPAESITYIEAHGTGTPLGDPVEVAALTEVFAASTERRGFCGLGSIKTNIGHLDAAAGIAGLLKAVLAVEHGVLPPSLHFETPNPRIDFARSPFYVNTECRPWRPEGWPRRAGVSAFAIGGVNAHVIVEEPPAPEPSATAPPWQLLVLSARTETALDAMTERLLGHLRAATDLADIADVAYTLQVGRRAFRHRRTLVCSDLEDAAGVLERRDPRRLLTGTAAAGEPQVAFLFPGLGTEYIGMARGLYRDDAGFRARIDDCAERLAPLLGLDLREVLFLEEEEVAAEPGLDLRGLLGRAPRSSPLLRTAVSQPAVFAVEYALACRLIDWGIRPQAMVGFSIGEYVAACLSGVLSLDDALRLVAGRARLIDELPAGAMLAVPLSESAVAPWLAEGDLSLAAVAGPELTVLAGTEEAVAAAEERLTAAGHVCRRLQTSHAFHSSLMEPVVESFLALFEGIELRPPEIPYLSNVTGAWITEEQATDPAYWVEHLRGTVRFADAMEELWREPGRVLVEVGPGQTLSSWALQQSSSADPVALPTLRHAFERTDDLAFLLQTVGRLWLTGLRPDWPALWAEQPRRRVPLPTYPFERQRYWIEPAGAAAVPSAAVPAEAPIAVGTVTPAASARRHSRPNLHVPYAPPRDATERRLVEILGELLRVETVGIHDGFFDLGGDSLLATHLVARLNQELGAELTLRSIFESPTAAELAVAVAAHQGKGAGAWGPVLRRIGNDSPSLSFAQRRLWFLDQLDPGNPAYNVPAAVLLTGPLDRSVLAAGLDEVVARHEALRTTFGVFGGFGDDEEPVQRIAAPAPLPFPCIDLAGLPEQAREAEALRLAAAEALRPFDLARDPLLRAALLRLGAERHIALFTMHHMVGDGWSADLLVRELVALYPAFALDRPSPLPPLPVQYADFVLWQRDNLRGAELESQLAFWRGALAGAPAVLDLPADRPRPARASGRGGAVAAALPAEPVDALKTLGRRAGATPFMTLLAVFYALLHRLTGETDLVVGTPVANRRRPELEGLIGFFANTLVLRAGLPAGEPTFSGLLAAVREAALSAYAHQDLPFEKLVEELAPERSLAHSPLFQVMFLLHGTPVEEREISGLTLAPFGSLAAAERAAKFDLTLELVESGPGLTTLLEFRRDLFDATTASRLLGHFAVLAAALSEGSEGRLAELPLLGESDRHQLLAEWNDTQDTSFPEAMLLHQLFEAQAAARPAAPALVCGVETLTYGDLDARAGRLARHLRGLGVGPEVPVGVCAGRSADLVVALLAVLKAGGAYLPLDPGYPPERLALLMEDTAAPVLVAPSSLADLLPPGAVRVALDAPETWAASGESLPPRALPGNLAYLIYTSGSTGRPKAVAIPHGAAVALVCWTAEVFAAKELDGMLASTSICFDLSVFEIFVPLSLGGRVILAENALELPQLAAAGEVRMINTVPSAMGELVRLEAIPPSVRTVGLAGEPLRRDLVQRIHATAPGVERVLNLYGPSETTTYSTWTAVEREGTNEPAIGRPITGTRAHVLDGSLAPVPIGVPGELFLSGAGLARGYLGRPALTAERWLPDPFADGAGGRLYRTGDRVRLRPDGRLDLLGRADAQVKIRGFRIEPGEIEAALTALAEVAQAAVVVHGQGEDRRLIAWVVARPGESLSAAVLRSALRERLPDFMIPAVFAFVDELPLNANGKVDRGALARRPVEAPARDGIDGIEVEERPLSPLEQVVAAIFCEVLGRERVGRGESFFDLGGHSLLATRVVSRLRAAFGVELPLRRLFEAPTVAGLAAVVAGAAHGDAAAAPPLVPVARGGDLPLSFAQQRLWFIDQLEGGSLYNMPIALRVSGELSVAVLSRVLAEVVRRHESLRTVFPGSGGRARQVILPPPPRNALTVPLVDLTGLSPERRQPVAEGLVREDMRRPFDLARGPLLRSGLWRLGETEHVLLLTLHHIVTDGWSMGVLVREMTALYAMFAVGRPSPLPELPVQYADFAAWQRSWLSGDVLDAELRYWRDRLAGAPPVLELPTDRPRPAVQSFRGAVRPLSLPPALSAALAALSRREGATPFMTLVSALSVLLSRFAGQTDLTLGTVVAGRHRLEIEGLIGFFVNSLVLRPDLSGAPRFTELLSRVRREALDAYAHQDLPFEKLVEDLAPERSLAHAPLFQVAFAWQNAAMPAMSAMGATGTPGELALPGLRLVPLELADEVAKFDLSLALQEAGDRIVGDLSYARDLFDAPTAGRLAAAFSALLAAVIEDPALPVSHLSLLGPGERHQLVVEWNATAQDFPETTLHELFAHRAALHPGATAVVCGAESLTYAALRLRARRLACRLSALGIAPEEPVALCLHRSPLMLAAVLGVLEAGGAYMPFDTGLPGERLTRLWENAGRPLLLTERRLLSGLAIAIPEARVLCLDELDAEEPAAEGPFSAPLRRVDPGCLAWVIHTSGSTGAPKGVACSHRGAVSLLTGFERGWPLAAGSRGSWWTSLSFDASIIEIFWPLLGGSAVHIVPEEVRQEAEGFLDWLAAERIHSAYVPPFMIVALLKRLEASPGAIPLRRLLVGVEPIAESHLRRIAELCPGLVLLNGYGPTEATICTTLYDVEGQRGRADGSGITPIGRPIANNAIYLFDGELRPAPVGVAGELYIGGIGVARGYLRQPHLTAERFVPNPWSEEGGGRLYRTGDLVRLASDGNLEFLGRTDRQIKLRGFRIELGEIEAALAGEPGVGDVAVVLRGGLAGGRGLVAYVAPAPGADLSGTALRERLKSKLPAYMVPASVVVLAALPLTSGGKLDRRWLAEQGPLPDLSAAAVSRAASPVEELVAGLFAAVLEISGVGLDADFFALGGHSLLATRLISRVRATFGIEMPLRTIFEQPTVAGLAARVEEAVQAGARPAAPPIERLQREAGAAGLPLSFAQQRLWFIDQLGGGALYSVPFALRMSGELSVALLERVLAEVVRRHEVLRTVFSGAGGQARQMVLPPPSLNALTVPVVDLTGLSPASRQPVAETLASAEARRPFDLTRGPLLRAGLWRLSETEHVLLFVLHHIAGDGWSLGVLVREVTALYAELAAGRPSPLPELPVQYADFAAWQRSWLSGDVLNGELRYWRDRLAGAPPVLELPTDRPRPAVQSFRGAVRPLALPPGLSAALAALSRREGATLFMTLVSAFSVLLSRWTGQTDLTLGTPVAGRRQLEIESLIGFFVNTLVLRPDLSGEPRFTELLSRVRREAFGAYAHQDLPFEKLVEHLAPERSLSHTPLFQVTFTWQNAEVGDLELPGLRLVPLELSAEVAQFDLSLLLQESGGGIAGVLYYSTDLFDGTTIARWIGQLEVLLRACADSVDVAVAELPLLSAAERHQLAFEWNGDADGESGTICSLFAAQVERRREAVAVRFGEERLSYGDLDRLSNRLARRLRNLGVGPEVPVGLCAERSLELVVGLLGILKAGGAYVPLDPQYPAERLALLIEDTLLPVVVGQQRLLGELPVTAWTQLVPLEGDEASWREQESADPLAVALSGESLAYVMYTSGSTGRPKGVGVVHRGVARLVRAGSFMRFGDDEVFLQLAPVSFDASTLEIWGALLTGGCLVMAPPGAPSVEDLARWIAADGVTSLWLTAGLFHELAERAPASFRPLRQLLAGGDVLRPQAVRRVLLEAPGLRLINGYGPTENTTFTACHAMEQAPEALEAGSPVPIGRPIAGTEVYVVDGGGLPVPLGVAGELLAGGAGLARGYGNRPELTAERWVPDGVSGGQGRRLYRTGDRVRWRVDGRLEFLGRVDRQVKVRGYRIEPGEIETALLADGRVREAVVTVREEGGDKRLVAYLVPEAGHRPTLAQIREHLGERLPEAMMPSALVILESLPLTARGKVDRESLPPPEAPEAGTAAGWRPPRTPVEEILAAIWGEVLGVARVGVDDNFFDLGGHSLLATRAISQVRSAFQVELGLAELFTAPTVAGLAARVEEAVRAEARPAAPPIERVPREAGAACLPLSFAQQRLWFIDQLEGGSVYNMPFALRMSGPLSVALLERVLAEVVRRHEALRTVFSSADGRACQVILPPAGLVIPVVDLAGLAPASREAAATSLAISLATEEARRPFDLARGPLLRVRLWRLGVREHLMLFAMHHIVSDGWSLGVLVREVTALYTAFFLGRPSPLAELPVQYADFAAWQRGWLSGEVLARELEHWRRRLAGAPPVLELPADRPRPAVRSLRGAIRASRLSPALTQKALALARRLGATLFMILAGAFQGWLARISGQTDFTLGTPIAGRNRLETEGLIGFFVNTLVLRADLPGDPCFGEILSTVRQETLEAYQHQDLPFEKLVEELDPERSLSRSPLFQVMLVLQNNSMERLEMPGVELQPVAMPPVTTDFDLTLALQESEQGLEALLDYSTDLFDGATGARFLAQFERLLEAAAEAPETRLSQLPLLGAGERFQVLAEWNDAGPQAHPDGLLHELVLAQAARTPERVALTCGGEHLSYRELAAQATRLACELAALGARAEMPAGILLERGAERIVAVLGVLLAGAFYLPLDPALPQERLAQLLAGSRASLVVTREELLPRLPPTVPITAVCLDRLRAPALAEPDHGMPGNPSNAAYVLYTSGSTGRPKGVVVEHRAAAWYARCAAANFALASSDRTLQFASLSFDVSIEEIFPILAVGGCLAVFPAGDVPAAGELLAVCRASEVTALTLATAYWHELVTEIEARPEALPPALRLVSIGGEKARPDRVASWQRIAPGSTIYNGYGPTETTVIATQYRLRREPWDATADLPLGRPIPGARAYVLDRCLEPLPPGVPGELAIGGAGLARGYLGEPAMTAERFVPDPFGGAGVRLYRTGDLARCRPDGTFEFLGRIDHQIKLRGFRIEPGEIELALTSRGDVAAAVVVLREGLPGGPALVAYVTPAPGADLSGAVLREGLRNSLPAYMVPAHVMLLEALPLTPGGKLDRRWLAERGPLSSGTDLLAGGASRVAPRTAVEELLAGIFSSVLGIDNVGTDADFFSLGGHSLLATQLVSRVRAAFGIELPLRAVFEQPTIAGLGREIEKASRSGGSAAVEMAGRVPRTENLPLSFTQERLWFLQQLEPGSAAYNMPMGLEITGALRTGALGAALTEVVRRHESLRTTFGSVDGVLCQRIAPPPVAPVALPLVDLSALPEAARRPAADRLAQWHAGWELDLERGPLCVWLLVRLAEERYRFLLNVHHTIADGWSLQVLCQELGELYAASSEGRPARLPELPIQYADFASWQRRWLAETQEKELAYWETRLGGEVAAAEIPTDRPRPAVQTFRGGQRQRVLSEDLTARLKRFGQAESTTLFMTLLAAMQALLSRHSGEHDVAVGVPVAGRQWAGTEELIGCFLNTLVLRTDTSGEPSFRALAARVRTVTLEAYAHQNVPFEAVLARLDLRRDLSRSPLFQVLFNLLNLPAAEVSLSGLEVQALAPAEVPSKLDMTFYISENDARLGIGLVYNADLFDEARMEDLLAQLEMFLTAALERPGEPVASLPLVTAAMRQVLPDPTLALDASWIGSVYDLFAAVAARAPERTAVADDAGAQSYGDLLSGSRRVAGWLAAQGVRRGDPVAILAVRAAPLVEAVLGVLGAGAAFLMIDSAYPALRQLEMLRQAAPRAWISIGSPSEEEAAVPAEVRAWLREAGCPCLALPPGGTGAVADLAPFAWEAPEVRIGPEDVACIGFTSGSTGGPKGILGLHGSLSHFLPAHCRQFGLGPDDRFSLLSGLGHDPLQREIFTALYLGGTIVVPDPSAFGISGRLAAWLCREQVTVAHLTPTLGQLLTELPPDGMRELVPSLRRVLLVGESLTRQDVARLRALAPGVSCINLYGSTETQRAVAFHVVAAEEAEAAQEVTERAQQVLPLGRGVPDVQLLVLNPAGGLAGLGELGEIAVRSPHLARGYLGNAELTARRFQVNPFTPPPGVPSDRIYRTGDLGRYRADGEVVFAGRLDQQVKLRGFRIEPGEIEGALVGLSGVMEAVVLLRTDLPGGAGLVAYVRAEEGREMSLRGELEARLPAYMVPAAFVRLDKLPRSANGKLDRQALLRIAPELGGRAVRALPRTPAEDLLAGIWSRVLGVERIGTEQSFFELGGHSLLATQMVSRVRDVFGVELPLRSLFMAPTLAGLAAEIERLRCGGAPERPTIASFRRDRGAPPPLSFAQERYWSGRHQEARSVASTIPMLIHIAGPLDRACLRRALAAVVDRHELLRTSFRESPEGPIQVIHAAMPVEIREVDLERLGAEERIAEVLRLSSLDGRLHFDYERPPLFRATLFLGGAEEHVLLFTIHHVASDWWSTPILIGEVGALYLALLAGRPSPLPPLAAQFQDFARWQRRLSSEEAQASQVAFWREHLSGAVPIDLGGGRPRPCQRTFAAGMEEVLVPEELERQLDAFSAQQGVTLFITLLTAFKTLLHFETGRDDLVVPCSFANRNQLETEALIGNLATALPLRTRLSGVRTFRELLLQVRDVTLLAHDHPDIFWEPVVEGMSFLEEGDRGGLSTFRILLQLLKVPRAAPARDQAEPEATAGSDLRVTPLPVDTGRMRLDLTLFLAQADRLAGRFRYNRDVLDEARVRGMRDRFLRILAAVVADPECLLAELPFADPAPQELGTPALAVLGRSGDEG